MDNSDARSATLDITGAGVRIRFQRIAHRLFYCTVKEYNTGVQQWRD